MVSYFLPVRVDKEGDRVCRVFCKGSGTDKGQPGPSPSPRPDLVELAVLR